LFLTFRYFKHKTIRETPWLKRLAYLKVLM